MDDLELETTIERAFQNPQGPWSQAEHDAVLETLARLDRGELRSATPRAPGDWEVHVWIQHAILLYFKMAPLQASGSPPFAYWDKIPLKTSFREDGVRAVPPATARYGSFVERGAVLLPCYVNIGARVGAGTMVDTWATIGSCAQVGRNVHVSGGVGIGGLLEPPGERPVIIEDDVFLGSRCVIVEGIVVEEGAVLGANVSLTATTPILDVTGPQEVQYKGRVPARSVVVPGQRIREFPAGRYAMPCALIIGKRNEGTDKKTAINQFLRGSFDSL